MIRSLAGSVRRRAVASLGASAMVLTYHRVADVAPDPERLAVSPAAFAAHVETLAASRRVVTLREMVSALRDGRLVDGTVALTFDDGYADNLHGALPVLEAWGVPATVFVSSGNARSGREYWWDELARLVLEWPELPGALRLEAGEAAYATEVADGGRPEDSSCGWSVLDGAATMRQRLYLELSAFVRPLDSDAREDVLRQLRSALGAGSDPRSSQRPLTPDEVAALDASPLVEIGAHTLWHETLSRLPMERQRAAIREDKRALEEICGRRMELFSYPYGQRADFTAETESIVREAGFRGACANYPRLVKPWTDAFAVPRFVVRDWSGDELARRVSLWFEGRAAWSAR